MVELENQNYIENKMIYKSIERKLKKVLGKKVIINHVGSTAIPNMVGKNIIDVLVAANDSLEFESFKEKIKQLGYFPSLKSATDIYQFFACKEGETKKGDIHIHLVITKNKRYDDFLILKEYLLSNKKEADDYKKCKINIVNNISNERKEYKNIKGEYVTKLIERANDFYKKENEKLLLNLKKLHTTELGNKRIKENLKINKDVVSFCSHKIMDKNCHISKKGKNWYCEIDNIIITVNSSSYTIITAHKK